MVKFNREGVRQLRADPSLAALTKYFDSTRDPSANAWVLNVLLCKPGSDEQDDGGDETTKPSPLSVSPHVDETLGHSSPDSFMAHVVRESVMDWMSLCSDLVYV